MRNFQCLEKGVDVLPLLLAIKRRPDLWKEDTYLRDYPQGPFADRVDHAALPGQDGA
jgi:hypothetical protein